MDRYIAVIFGDFPEDVGNEREIEATDFLRATEIALVVHANGDNEALLEVRRADYFEKGARR